MYPHPVVFGLPTSRACCLGSLSAEFRPLDERVRRSRKHVRKARVVFLFADISCEKFSLRVNGVRNVPDYHMCEKKFHC